MMSWRTHRPSAGFVMVVVIHLLTLLLIGWGARTPLLDRIWTLEHELKAGIRSELTEGERALFQRAFATYPDLAAGLLDGRRTAILSAHRDGWSSQGSAVMARLGGVEQAVALQTETPPDGTPARVELVGSGWRRALTMDEQGRARTTFPSVAGAELVAVEARGKDRAEVAFKIDFEDTP